MQCYINVSMGDLDCLGRAGFWCQSWHLCWQIQKAAFHAVAPSEGAETAGIMKGFWILWSWFCSVSGTERQIHFHHSQSAGDVSYRWKNLLKNHYLGWKSMGTPKQKQLLKAGGKCMLWQKNDPVFIVCFLWSKTGLQKEGGSPFVCFNRRLPLCLINSR